MALLPNLSTSSTFSASDYLVMAQSNQNNAQRVSGAAVATYILSLIGSSFTSIFSAPSATGFTTTVTQTDDNYWLILTPVAGYAAGTIVLPASTVATDKQIVQVTCTQSIAALTMTSTGATITGEPTAIDGFTSFAMQYDAVTSTWYLVSSTATGGGGGTSETIQYESILVNTGEGTLTCDPAAGDSWVIGNASDAIEDLTIALPDAASSVDKQVIQISLDIFLTGEPTLTVTSAGATVVAAETVAGEMNSFSFKYDETNTTWYRLT